VGGGVGAGLGKKGREKTIIEVCLPWVEGEKKR